MWFPASPVWVKRLSHGLGGEWVNCSFNLQKQNFIRFYMIKVKTHLDATRLSWLFVSVPPLPRSADGPHSEDGLFISTWIKKQSFRGTVAMEPRWPHHSCYYGEGFQAARLSFWCFECQHSRKMRSPWTHPPVLLQSCIYLTLAVLFPLHLPHLSPCQWFLMNYRLTPPRWLRHTPASDSQWMKVTEAEWRELNYFRFFDY